MSERSRPSFSRAAEWHLVDVLQQQHDEKDAEVIGQRTGTIVVGGHGWIAGHGHTGKALRGGLPQHHVGGRLRIGRVQPAHENAGAATVASKEAPWAPLGV